MTDKYYSVDEISTILEIHPKTVQRYIREGKIRATKVGKAWRVLERDFNSYMDIPIAVQPTPHKRASSSTQGKVSSVVDISVSSTEDAIHTSNMLTATLNAPRSGYGNTSMNIQYIEAEGILRVMLYGNVKFMSIMMGMISDFIDQKNL